MPTNMATCCCEKAVLVTVYVEKPRRRILHHHLHHHLHHTIRKEVIQQKHGVTGKGYNRRAELLHYSQRLRLSAQPPPPATTSSQSKPESSTHQQPSNKNATVQITTKHSRTPAWLRNWIILIPSFLRSLTSLQAKKNRKKKKRNESASYRMKDVMKSLQVKKKWEFISKLFSTSRKPR